MPKSKTGGRQKGTPNFATVRFQMLLDKYKIDPIKDIAAQLPLLEPKERVKLNLELLQYLYPKRKALEVTDLGNGDEKNQAELDALKAEIRELVTAAVPKGD